MRDRGRDTSKFETFKLRTLLTFRIAGGMGFGDTLFRAVCVVLGVATLGGVGVFHNKARASLSKYWLLSTSAETLQSAMTITVFHCVVQRVAAVVGYGANSLFFVRPLAQPNAAAKAIGSDAASAIPSEKQELQ